jgi:hypothetical protein
MYHSARADFLERARRSSFLIVLILTIFVGYSFLPPRSSNFVTLSFGNHRGIYNSAWVGNTVALLSSLSLSFIGFYLISNAVEKDRITRVGQILATTHLSKILYTIGKTVSNFLVLAAIIVCAAITAGVMQVMLGEDTHIDLWALLSPFLFITLPTMAVISALAVFFETIPWPHNSIMNVVYFFLWLIVFNTLLPGQGVIRFVQQNDVWGATLPLSMMETATMDAFPHYKGGTALAASPLNDTFTWNGIQWTWDLIQMRLVWVFVALSVSLIAAIWFSRFDPAREWPRQSDKRSMLAKREETVTAATTRVSLTPLTRTSSGPHFGFLLLSELRLILTGKPWWWYFIAGSLSVLSLFVSLETVKALLLPIAWLWPLFVWSELSNREIRHQTSQIVFSSAPPLRYLSVQWLSGVGCSAHCKRNGFKISIRWRMA